MSAKRVVLLFLVAACALAVIAASARATPVVRTVGAFDLTFYNKLDSDGESTGRLTWTSQQMDDIAASFSAWTSRITNAPGRQIQYHLFWANLSGATLADTSGPNNGDGTTSWTYTEHVWRDSVNYAGPWTGFDGRIRFDIQAAGVIGGWNFGSAAPAANQIDFRSVMTHEIGHALGFMPTYYSGDDLWGHAWGTSSDPFTSAGYKGLSRWDKNLLDNAGNRPANQATGTPGNFSQVANPVWFTGANSVAYFGGNVPVYAPSPFQGGSSLSHLDETRIPNALMSPVVAQGQMVRQPLRVEWEIMKDIGWSVLTTKTWTKGAGTLSWATAANWSPDGAPDATWDLMLDGAGLADGDVMDIGGNQAVNILSISSSAGFTIGGASGTLTIAKGNVSRTSGSSGVQTLARPVALGATAVWDIAGAGQLNVTGNISGGYGIEKRGAALLALSGANNYTGRTTISAGTLRAADGAGLPTAGNLALSGGVFESTGAATFTRSMGTGASAVQWTGGGGFSASGGKMIVAIGGTASPTPLVWGAGNFVPAASALILGSLTADNETEFRNNINFGGAVRTVTVNDNPLSTGDFATLSGVLSGGGLVKDGGGMLVLSGASTYAGGTTIRGGTLAAMLGSSLGVGNVAIEQGATLVAKAALGAPALTLASGAGLDVETTGDYSGAFQANGGSLTVGPGYTLTVLGEFGIGAGATFGKDGTGTLILAGPQTSGAASVLDITGGAVFLNTDAGSPSAANLSISVTGADLYFGSSQHLDTLTIGDGGEVVFSGAQIVVLKHLVMGGLDFGATTLTPEPATLGLLAFGGLAIMLRRRRP